MTDQPSNSDRLLYLKRLAEDYGVQLKYVLVIADILGPNEDYDGLVSHIDELSTNPLYMTE